MPDLHRVGFGHLIAFAVTLLAIGTLGYLPGLIVGLACYVALERP